MFPLSGTVLHGSNVRKHMLNCLQPSVTHVPSTENILTLRSKNALLAFRCELWLFLTHAKMTVISSTSCMFLYFQNREPHRNSTFTLNCARSYRTLLLSLLLVLLLLEAPGKHTRKFFSEVENHYLGTASALLAPLCSEATRFANRAGGICVEGGIVWHLPVLYTVGYD